MTPSKMRRQIDALSSNTSTSRADRVAELMQIYLDARALQRAANEGGMTAESSSSADDLSHVEHALRRLGVNATEANGGNAASL